MGSRPQLPRRVCADEAGYRGLLQDTGQGTVYEVTAAFFILLTFTLAQQIVVPCPNTACVMELQYDARRSSTAQRLQVWPAADFGRSKVSGVSFSPPIIDEQYQ